MEPQPQPQNLEIELMELKQPPPPPLQHWFEDTPDEVFEWDAPQRVLYYNCWHERRAHFLRTRLYQHRLGPLSYSLPPCYRRLNDSWFEEEVPNCLAENLRACLPALHEFLAAQDPAAPRLCLTGEACVDLLLLRPPDSAGAGDEVVFYLDLYFLGAYDAGLLARLVDATAVRQRERPKVSFHASGLLEYPMNFGKWCATVRVHFAAYPDAAALLTAGEYDIDAERVAYDGARVTATRRALACLHNRVLRARAPVYPRFVSRVYRYLRFKQFSIVSDAPVGHLELHGDSGVHERLLIYIQHYTEESTVRVANLNTWLGTAEYGSVDVNESWFPHVPPCLKFSAMIAHRPSKANLRTCMLAFFGATERPVLIDYPYTGRQTLGELLPRAAAEREAFQLIMETVSLRKFQRKSVERYLGSLAADTLLNVYASAGAKLVSMTDAELRQRAIDALAPYLANLFAYIEAHAADSVADGGRPHFARLEPRWAAPDLGRGRPSTISRAVVLSIDYDNRDLAESILRALLEGAAAQTIDVEEVTQAIGELTTQQRRQTIRDDGDGDGDSSDGDSSDGVRSDSSDDEPRPPRSLQEAIADFEAIVIEAFRTVSRRIRN